jgi:hypothetical protein
MHLYYMIAVVDIEMMIVVVEESDPKLKIISYLFFTVINSTRSNC